MQHKDQFEELSVPSIISRIEVGAAPYYGNVRILGKTWSNLKLSSIGTWRERFMVIEDHSVLKSIIFEVFPLYEIVFILFIGLVSNRI
jgi:hypothetical protein